MFAPWERKQSMRHADQAGGRWTLSPNLSKKGQTAATADGLSAVHMNRSLGNQAMNRILGSGLPINKLLRKSTSGGEPLAEPVKTVMETTLQANLDPVRIHTGSQAAVMARSIGAAAFTVGRNIYFNEGQYHPLTPRGARLLAHELVHSIQQSFYAGQFPQSMPVSSPHEPEEQQAEAVAARFATGKPGSGRQGFAIERMNTQLIQPKIQRAMDLEVGVYETKDHSSGYDDAPDESFKLEANSLNEAGTRLVNFTNGIQKMLNRPAAITQLSFYGHGSPGYQSVGAGSGYDSAKEISLASLSQYSADYKNIFTPVADGANVYMRGCNVGAGEEGLKILQGVKNSCKTLASKDIEVHGWTGKSYHNRVLAYDWYEQTGERVSSGDKAPKTNWEELKKRGAAKK